MGGLCASYYERWVRAMVWLREGARSWLVRQPRWDMEWGQAIHSEGAMGPLCAMNSCSRLNRLTGLYAAYYGGAAGSSDVAVQTPMRDREPPAVPDGADFGGQRGGLVILRVL